MPRGTTLTKNKYDECKVVINGMDRRQRGASVIYNALGISQQTASRIRHSANFDDYKAKRDAAQAPSIKKAAKKAQQELLTPAPEPTPEKAKTITISKLQGSIDSLAEAVKNNTRSNFALANEIKELKAKIPGDEYLETLMSLQTREPVAFTAEDFPELKPKKRGWFTK